MARWTIALDPDPEEEGATESLCRKASARETLARPWSTSSLETERASFALAEDERDALESLPPPPPTPTPMLPETVSSSLAVPHTPSVTSASRCLLSSRGSTTRRTVGCLTRARAAAPARAAARAASPSSGELAEAAIRERLSMSQTETSGRAAAEPVPVVCG